MPDPRLKEMFADNYTDRVVATPPGMAHLAGSGPPGKKCFQCTFFDANGRRPGKCFKYKVLMRTARMTGQIPINTPACKYFSEI